MLKFVLSKMSYDKEEKVQYLSKRLGGMWLLWIGVVLTLSIYCGGKELVHKTIFGIGYGVGLYFFFGVKVIREKLSYGPPSPFQRKVTKLSIILMFVLMFFIGGPYFQTMDYRMIWLGALLAVAIHFIPFSLVHGKSMIVLSFLLLIVIAVGYINPSIPFSTIGYIDAVIKMLFGILLLFSKKTN